MHTNMASLKTSTKDMVADALNTTYAIGMHMTSGGDF